MRRIWMIFLFLFLPIVAFAQPGCAPYDYTLSLRYQQLNEEEQQLFDNLYDALWNHQTRIDFRDGADYNTVKKVVNLLAEDAPELCAAGSSWSVGYYSNQPDIATSLEFFYKVADVDAEAMVAKAKEIKEASNKNTTDYATLLHFYDLVCTTITYQNTTDNDHTVAGALNDGLACCDGYASTLSLLLRLSGFSCSMVTGDVYDEGKDEWIPHAWNVVTVDNQNYQFDATLDDQDDSTFHWYFGMPNSWMSRDHRLGETNDIALSESLEANWHIRTGHYIIDENIHESLQGELVNLFQSGMMEDLRFASQEGYQWAISSMDEILLAAHNQAADENARIDGRVSIYKNDLQHCLTVMLFQDEASSTLSNR